MFFGYDFMLPVAHRLIEDGHELTGMFCFDCDNIFNFNQQCQAFAQEGNIPLIMSPATDIHIDSFIAKGAQIFFAAGYPHKIPPIDPGKAIGINMHPSYLPHARGLMPVPHILMNEDAAAAGMTVHKMTQEFDRGDILMQRRIKLADNESVETYCAKTLLIGPELASDVFASLDTLWEDATPQQESEASTAPAPTDEMRILDWNKNVADITRIGRAFGRFGCLAKLGGDIYSVMQFSGWEEEHNHAPGTCVVHQQKLAVIAVSNGYICLEDFHKMSPPPA